MLVSHVFGARSTGFQVAVYSSKMKDVTYKPTVPLRDKQTKIDAYKMCLQKLHNYAHLKIRKARQELTCSNTHKYV